MLSLTQGGAANLPLWIEPQDGNTSDKTSFHETVKRVQAFIQRIEHAPDNLCFVVDSAFYVPEKLAQLEEVYWITRVPSTLKQAKALLTTSTLDCSWTTIDENYAWICEEKTLANIRQRWVMIRSQQAYSRELTTFHRRLEKGYDTLNHSLWHLSHQVFSCEADVRKAITPYLKKLTFHDVSYTIKPIFKYKKRGRPSPSDKKIPCGYQISYTISSNLMAVRQHKDCLGRFILATNQCDRRVLSNEAVLSQYKQQSTVETGFKFIKDNAFELDSFYLKTPERIGALMAVMTFCLLVYNFSQYHIRKCLDENDDALPNQLGKPVKNPTMKWIAELMGPIAVVSIQLNGKQQRFITNVNPIHKRIIAYFGPKTLSLYELPPDIRAEPIPYHRYKKLSDWCQT